MDVKPQFMSGNLDSNTGYAQLSFATTDGKYIAVARNTPTTNTSNYDENIVVYEVSEDESGNPQLKQKNILNNFDLRTTGGHVGSSAFTFVEFLSEPISTSHKTQSCLV